MDSMHEHRRRGEGQFRHPVTTFSHPYSALLTSPDMPVDDGLRVELLGDRARHRSQTTCRETSGPAEDDLLILGTDLGVAQADSFVENDLNVST